MSGMTETAPAAPKTGEDARARGRLDLQFVGIRVIALLLLLYAALAVDGFATRENVNAWLSSVALVGVAAVGMALITIGGQVFMLSMGATAAVSTLLFATFLQFGAVPALLLTTACGLVIGLLQGYATGVRGSDPIITTIAAASIILGIGQLGSGGRTVVGDGDASWIGEGSVLGVLPVQALFFFAVAILLQYVLTRTRFGRELRLCGSNRDAAYAAGVRVPRTIVIAYGLAAACAALSGALLGAENGQGTLQAGLQLDFDAIGAVVVGGILVTGGRGTVLDAAFGALFIALVGNILLVQGYDFDVQLLVKGLILVAAIALAAFLGRRR